MGIKFVPIDMDGYECILCHELYMVIPPEDKDCPLCGGTGNFLATVTVDLEKTD